MLGYAPLALFVYNRPDHTRRTVEALAANTLAGQTPLHVFSDAPKNAAANQAVAEVRAYIRTIGGFKSVTIIERETNFGLARSIIDGVTGLCGRYGCVIVLEDDLITSPYFLSYMNDGLERYAHEEQVMQIAGYMFPIRLGIEKDALFLPFITSWGWATWQRAWQKFDADATGYGILVNNPLLRQRFDLGGRYRYFDMLQSQQQGKTDSWAIRWYLSVFLCNGLALYPKRTLVRNIGFDGSGVNCAVRTIPDSRMDMDFQVMSLPESIQVSEAQALVLERMPVPSLSVVSVANRLLGYLKRVFPFR